MNLRRSTVRLGETSVIPWSDTTITFTLLKPRSQMSCSRKEITPSSSLSFWRTCTDLGPYRWPKVSISLMYKPEKIVKISTNGHWNLLDEVIQEKEKLGAYGMKRVDACAHLPTACLFEPAKRQDDRADYCLGCSFLPRNTNEYRVRTSCIRFHNWMGWGTPGRAKRRGHLAVPIIYFPNEPRGIPWNQEFVRPDCEPMLFSLKLTDEIRPLRFYIFESVRERIFDFADVIVGARLETVIRPLSVDHAATTSHVVHKRRLFLKKKHFSIFNPLFLFLHFFPAVRSRR